MFSYRGIVSNLKFIDQNEIDFVRIIDYLFAKYSVNKIQCEIVLHNRNWPEFFGDRMALATDASLVYYQQIDFQFAHELTHAIQYNKGMYNAISLHQEREHPLEAEARQNARICLHELLGYKDYPISMSD